MTKHTILQGDAAAHMADYDDKTIDAVVTSPPYNLGIDYGSAVSDKMSREDYIEKFTTGWLSQVSRLLKDDGHFFLNLGASPSDPMLPFQVMAKASAMGWQLQNTIHWIKSITFDDKAGNKVTRGHFKPINSPRFLNDAHEYIFHLTKDGKRPIHRKAEGVGVPYSDTSNVERWGHTGGDNLRCGGNNWLIPNSSDQDGRWLALLVDAEGSICVNIDQRPGGRAPQHNPVVTISNTNMDLLEVANGLCHGSGSIRPRSETPEHALVQGTRPGFSLRFDGDAAQSLIARMRPWLIVKQRQAKIALHLGWLKKQRNGSTKPLTEAEVAERDRLCDMWKALNAGEDVDVSGIADEDVTTLCGGNNWQIPYITIQSSRLQRPHPATFPQELVTRCLRLAGNPKVVLDPFVGIGTTSLAAAECEAEWAIGIDLSMEYSTEAAYRLGTKAHYA